MEYVIALIMLAAIGFIWYNIRKSQQIPVLTDKVETFENISAPYKIEPAVLLVEEPVVVQTVQEPAPVAEAPVAAVPVAAKRKRAPRKIVIAAPPPPAPVRKKRAPKV